MLHVLALAWKEHWEAAPHPGDRIDTSKVGFRTGAGNRPSATSWLDVVEVPLRARLRDTQSIEHEHLASSQEHPVDDSMGVSQRVTSF